MPQEDRSHTSDFGWSDASAADVIDMIAREAGDVVWYSKAEVRGDENAQYKKENRVRFNGQERHGVYDLARLLWQLANSDLGDHQDVAELPHRIRRALNQITQDRSGEGWTDPIKELALGHEPFLKILIYLLSLPPAKSKDQWPKRHELLHAVLDTQDIREEAQSLFDTCALYRNAESHEAPARNSREVHEGLNQALGFCLLIIDAHFDRLSQFFMTPTDKALSDKAGLLAYLLHAEAWAKARLPRVYVEAPSKSGNRADRALDLVVESLGVGNPMTLVIGGPGAGKTTFLQSLCQYLAERSRERLESYGGPIQVPVYYSIAGGNALGPLVSSLLRQVIGRGWTSAREADPLEFLRDGKYQWVFLLDGLDEAVDFNEAISNIDAVSKVGTNISVVVSARDISLPPDWRDNQLSVELLRWGEAEQSEFLNSYWAKTSRVLEAPGVGTVWDLFGQPGLHQMARTPLTLTALADFLVQQISPRDHADDMEEGDTIPEHWPDDIRESDPSLQDLPDDFEYGDPSPQDRPDDIDDGVPSHLELDAARVVIDAILEHEFGKLPGNAQSANWEECLYRLRLLACKLDGEPALGRGQAMSVAGPWLHKLVSMGLLANVHGTVYFGHEAIKLASAIDHLKCLGELSDPGSEIMRLTAHWTEAFRNACRVRLEERDFVGLGVGEMLTAV